MFWDNFLKQCIRIDKSPSKVCEEIGLSNAAQTRWKNGSIPQDITLSALSDYFKVPVSELLKDTKDETGGMRFWDNFLKECNRINKAPSNVCEDIGLSRTMASLWKRGSVPRDNTLLKLADYFGISPADLLKEPDEAVIPQVIDTDLQPDPFDGLDLRTAFRQSTSAVVVPDAVLMPDNSMILDCIPKGAKCRIKETTSPDEDDIVAVIYHNDIIVRRWSTKGGIIILNPANPKYRPIITTEDELKQNDCGIYGVVTHVSFDIE